MALESGKNAANSGKPSISWAMMLGLVLLAILVAGGFAYLLIYPFFHQQPR